MYSVTLLSTLRRVGKLIHPSFSVSFLFRSNIEGNIEEDIDMKNQLGNKHLACSIECTDAVCKPYVDSGLIDPSMI